MDKRTTELYGFLMADGCMDREKITEFTGMLAGLENPEEALPMLEALSGKHPLLFMWHLGRQYALSARKMYNAGNISGAAALYEKSASAYADAYDDEFETPPDILPTLWNLSIAYESLGQHDKCIGILRKGLEYSRMFARWDRHFQEYVSDFEKAIGNDIQKEE